MQAHGIVFCSCAQQPCKWHLGGPLRKNMTGKTRNLIYLGDREKKKLHRRTNVDSAQSTNCGGVLEYVVDKQRVRELQQRFFGGQTPGAAWCPTV
jgi:hypothetical protein